MSNNIAIDLGYGYTKAVNGSKRDIFPSWVAPVSDMVLGSVFQSSVGHLVTIRKNNETREYMVGELARRESRLASYTLDTDKYNHRHNETLLLTAAALMGVNHPYNIIVGLPLGVFSAQKEKVKNNLVGLLAEVAVDGKSRGLIHFEKIMVFPQGAGAVFAQKDIPRGRIGIVDVGFLTTNYMVVEVDEDGPVPVSQLSGSFESGVHLLHKAVADKFQKEYGRTPDAAALDQAVRHKTITFKGQNIDLSPIVNEAKEQVAQAISDRVLAAWAGHADYLLQTVLVGGGALALDNLSVKLPAAVVSDNPQWDNVSGFAAVGKQMFGV